MKTDFQSGVSPFRCSVMIQTDVSGTVQHVDIPQGQEMPPEVKSGALVAGRGQLLSCGEEEQLQIQPDFAAQLCLSSQIWEAFLSPSE